MEGGTTEEMADVALRDPLETTAVDSVVVKEEITTEDNVIHPELGEMDADLQDPVETAAVEFVVVKEEITSEDYELHQALGDVDAGHVRSNEILCAGKDMENKKDVKLHECVDDQRLLQLPCSSRQSEQSDTVELNLSQNNGETEALFSNVCSPGTVDTTSNSNPSGHVRSNEILCAGKDVENKEDVKLRECVDDQRLLQLPCRSRQSEQSDTVELNLSQNNGETEALINNVCSPGTVDTTSNSNPSGKPFSCSYCTDTFTDKSGLKEHLEVHRGEKLFQCSLCSARLTSKHSLHRHFQTHTGDKSFQCSFCSIRLSDKSSLKNHCKLHIDPHSCSFCSGKFIYKSTLWKHLGLHTGDRPYSCSFCPATFSNKMRMIVHISSYGRETIFVSSVFCYVQTFK